MTTSEAQRRQQILEAAEKLLRHYGPNKTTIAEIAREAAVGVGTVYLEFTSKDAIVEELSAGRHMSVLHDMREAAARPAADAAARVCAVLDARVTGFLRLADEGTHAPDLLHCACPAVRPAHERFQSAERALLAELLREGARTRELAVVEPEQTATVLLYAYASFAPPKLFMLPRAELPALLRGMHELVMKGLLARREGKRRA